MKLKIIAAGLILAFNSLAFTSTMDRLGQLLVVGEEHDISVQMSSGRNNHLRQP